MPHEIKVNGHKPSKWPSRPEMNVDIAGILKSTELTDDEKKQACENINALVAPKRLTGTVYVGHPYFGGYDYPFYVLDGIVREPSVENKEDRQMFDSIIGLLAIGVSHSADTMKASIENLIKLYQKGYVTYIFQGLVFGLYEPVRIYFSFNTGRKLATLQYTFIAKSYTVSIIKNLTDNTYTYGPRTEIGLTEVAKISSNNGKTYFCGELPSSITLEEAKVLYTQTRPRLVFNGETFITAELTDNSITIVYMGKGEDGQYGVQKTTFDNITWKTETT